MEITKGMKIQGKSLLIGSSLVIADLHFGQEEALNRKGVLIPRFQFKDIESSLMAIIKKNHPKELIITGDLKHEFGSILNTEWRNILKLRNEVLELCDRIVIIKGNHDIMLGPIARKANVIVENHYFVKDVLICHGDVIPDKKLLDKCKTIVIGHDHPAISLHKENRTEKFKCFLKGKYKDKLLIVLPSFNPLTIGNDVLSGNLLSPLLSKNINNFEVFVPDENDKPLYFGKVKDLK